MSRILVVVASSHGHTRTIGEALAQRLRTHGHEVVVADAGPFAPPPEGHDAIVLGSRVQFDRHAPALRDYVTRHHAALASRASYFFSVSLSASRPESGPDPRGYMASFLADVRWQPRARASFGGALPYRRYGRLMRLAMQLLARALGRPTDTTRDHVFTVWSMVERFADLIAADLAPQHVRVASA